MVHRQSNYNRYSIKHQAVYTSQHPSATKGLTTVTDTVIVNANEQKTNH